MTVLALVGAQYGSEGKGAVAYSLRNEYDVHVRTGGPNAGHTIHHEGRMWKMQAVPCGWTNPAATLIIGPGAVVDPVQLRKEITFLEDAGYNVRDRLHIDGNATVLELHHKELEGGVRGHAHQEIGSTGEGVGAARIARISRGVLMDGIGCSPYREVDHEAFWFLPASDTVVLLHRSIYNGKRVLLEGTQGSGLSLTHGPWPFVTSHDTNAAQLAADAGLGPAHITNVLLVARTFPIRVAGNSGPLPNELTWAEVGQPPEFTTVTKKIRRVAVWNSEQVRRAVALNGGVENVKMVLTFLDYLYPSIRGVTDWRRIMDLIDVAKYVRGREADTGVEIVGLGTGGATPGIAWKKEA